MDSIELSAVGSAAGCDIFETEVEDGRKLLNDSSTTGVMHLQQVEIVKQSTMSRHHVELGCLGCVHRREDALRFQERCLI